MFKVQGQKKDVIVSVVGAKTVFVAERKAVVVFVRNVIVLEEKPCA